MVTITWLITSRCSIHIGIYCSFLVHSLATFLVAIGNYLDYHPYLGPAYNKGINLLKSLVSCRAPKHLRFDWGIFFGHVWKCSSFKYRPFLTSSFVLSILFMVQQNKLGPITKPQRKIEEIKIKNGGCKIVTARKLELNGFKFVELEKKLEWCNNKIIVISVPQ